MAFHVEIANRGQPSTRYSFMRYGDLITRSFSVVWSHKYLWLLAVLGGSDVADAGFGVVWAADFGVNFVSRILPPRPWPVALSILLVLVIGWFVISCVTTGALVRASAEHDAVRPFALGLAWRAGLGAFSSILGLRLLQLLWVLLWVSSAATATGGLVVLGVVVYQHHQNVALAAIIVVALQLLAAAAVSWILVGLAFILAIRAVVLQQRGPIRALRHSVQLMRARPGRVVVLWLLQIALDSAGGTVQSLILFPAILVAAAIVAAAGVASGVVAALALGIPFGLVLLGATVLLYAVLGGYLSTYWTLAFRRFEMDAPRFADRQDAYP